jgi:hypothetical protein
VSQQVATLVAPVPDGVVVQAASRTEVGLTDQVSAFGSVAVHRWWHGELDLRDATLGVNLRVLDSAKLSIRVTPAFTLPLGSTTAQLVSVTPLSSGSVDPQLGADLVFGGTWVGAVSAMTRVPLYAGRDGRVQGALGVLGLTLGRRTGPTVPYVGLSGIGELADSRRENAFFELAGVAGIAVAPHPRWGVRTALRVPAMGLPQRPPYLGALTVAVTGVFGKPPEKHEH